MIILKYLYALPGFLRKVYGILSAQLVLSVLLAAFCLSVPSAKDFVQSRSVMVPHKVIIIVNVHFPPFFLCGSASLRSKVKLGAFTLLGVSYLIWVLNNEWILFFCFLFAIW